MKEFETPFETPIDLLQKADRYHRRIRFPLFTDREAMRRHAQITGHRSITEDNEHGTSD